MTVCIAALCRWKDSDVIVGASDRMLTASDIEFEPPQTKIANLTKNCTALVAGDSASQMTICEDTFFDLENESSVSVHGVAECFSKNFIKHRKQIAETKHLSPLGIDFDSFIKNQKHMSQDTVNNISDRLKCSNLDIKTIITGVDDKGGHIYVVSDPGKITYMNAVGFAAIGIGEWHAQSQFMFNGYTKTRSLNEALFMVYSAKRRAEVAPGVGVITDMFMIGQGEPQYVVVRDEVMEKLRSTYEEYQFKQKINHDDAMGEIGQYVEELTKEDENPENVATAVIDSGAPNKQAHE